MLECITARTTFCCLQDIPRVIYTIKKYLEAVHISKARFLSLDQWCKRTLSYQVHERCTD